MVFVEPLLKKSVREECKNPNWRVDEDHFVTDISMDGIEPGAINFSAGWFSVGHEVRTLFLSKFRFNLTASYLVRGISPLALTKP